MRLNSAATRAARCGRLTSLVRKSSAPRRRPDTASSSLSRAVRKMMGNSADSARRSRHRSKPPSASSSSEMSMMARSGRCAREGLHGEFAVAVGLHARSRAARAPPHNSRAGRAHLRRSRCAFSWPDHSRWRTARSRDRAATIGQNSAAPAAIIAARRARDSRSDTAPRTTHCGGPAHATVNRTARNSRAPGKLWSQHREASLNWLALGLLLAAWNAADDDAGETRPRPPVAARLFVRVGARGDAQCGDRSVAARKFLSKGHKIVNVL